MIKDMSWKMFKTTGNVDSYLEFKQIKNLERQEKEIKI